VVFRRVCGRAINVTWSSDVIVETRLTHLTAPWLPAPITTPYNVRSLHNIPVAYTSSIYTVECTIRLALSKSSDLCKEQR